MREDSLLYQFNNNVLLAKIGYLLLLIAFLSSCSSTKHLSEEDLILERVVYNIQTSDNKVKKINVKEELINLVKQKPVKKSYLNPRTWNKPLTIYNKNSTIESSESFEKFLRNREGFYQAQVGYKEKIEGRNVTVVYDIDLGRRYYIRSVEHIYEDSALQAIMTTYMEDTKILVGAPLEARSFENEKARIVSILKNEGYANFNGNYIVFNADSSDYQVDAMLYVYNPVNQTNHTKYEIGNINVFTEHNKSVEPRYDRVDTIDHIRYYAKTDRFLVRPQSIHDVIALDKGDKFEKSRESKMNLNLSRLSPYRFAVLDSYVDSTANDVFNYNIFLSPHQNKWIMDSGLNLFYSSISNNAGQNLFGFSGNLGFQNRNFRNRAIRHSVGLEGTLEFNLPEFPSLNQVLTNTLSIQVSNKFDIPKVLDVFRITRFLNRFNIISNESLDNIGANGTTTIDMSAGYTSILNFYDLLNLNASWAYNFQPNPRLKYTIRQIGINMISTDVDPTFRSDILDDFPLLARSFDNYLFTGFLFRELSIFKQTKETKGGSHFLLIGNFELSGFENFLLNKLTNALTPYNDNWKIGSLEFAEFIRLEGDFRYYKKVKDRSSFAARFNAAIAIPYGDISSIPYIKQYYVGGPNSLRGWQLRELGPGTYLGERRNNTAFFQAGDLKLEFSAEYRFDLFWYLEGAVFLDGGNIWLLRNDGSREGATFSSNFLDEIALSTGWGIRLDFDYFIFRFDFGYKLRNPFPDPETGSHFVLTNGNYNSSRFGNINFAINYPF